MLGSLERIRPVEESTIHFDEVTLRLGDDGRLVSTGNGVADLGEWISEDESDIILPSCEVSDVVLRCRFTRAFKPGCGPPEPDASAVCMNNFGESTRGGGGDSCSSNSTDMGPGIGGTISNLSLFSL